jgi:hypothetical protein
MALLIILQAEISKGAVSVISIIPQEIGITILETRGGKTDKKYKISAAMI